MPRVASFKITVIGELYRQLRYASPETRIRQMNAAESLVEDIDPQQLYPEDFIIFRITSYRPRSDQTPPMLVGEALMSDLINLVQCLSDSLDLPPDFNGRSPALLQDTASRLNISTKTVQRYRKRGLVCHYVLFPDQIKRLVCFEDSISRFVNRNQSRLRRASDFSRIEETIEQQIIRKARALFDQHRLSLNEVALRLAGQYDRAHETVRLLLKRHDQRAEKPIFDERGPLTQKDIRVIFRAWRFGVPVAMLARRFSKGAPAIHRAINRRRRELLKALDLQYVKMPTFGLEDAASIILSAPAVTGGLDNRLVSTDALLLIEQARNAQAMDEADEDALVAGYNFLKKQAAEGIALLDDSPNTRSLDEVETDLRWASALKGRLISAGFPSALKVIEQTLHKPLKRHPAEEIVRLIELAFQVISRCIESLDPKGRRQELAKVCAHALDMALAALYQSKPSRRAAVRHESGSIALEDFYRQLCPWQSWLEPYPGLGILLDRIDPENRPAIALRYGYQGGPPHTIDALAKKLGLSPQRATRLVQKMEAEMKRAGRRGI